MTTEFAAVLLGNSLRDQVTLQVGQTVCLTERTFGCQVTILADGTTGQQIAEIAADHIGLYDPTTGTRSYLPKYLIHKDVHRE
jgi:hypothetical protein